MLIPDIGAESSNTQGIGPAGPIFLCLGLATNTFEAQNRIFMPEESGIYNILDYKTADGHRGNGVFGKKRIEQLSSFNYQKTNSGFRWQIVDCILATRQTEDGYFSTERFDHKLAQLVVEGLGIHTRQILFDEEADVWEEFVLEPEDIDALSLRIINGLCSTQFSDRLRNLLALHDDRQRRLGAAACGVELSSRYGEIPTLNEDLQEDGFVYDSYSKQSRNKQKQAHQAVQREKSKQVYKKYLKASKKISYTADTFSDLDYLLKKKISTMTKTDVEQQ